MDKDKILKAFYSVLVNVIFWSFVIWLVVNFFFGAFDINCDLTYLQAMAVDLLYMLVKEFLGNGEKKE